ncbi:MAG: hypothetical protein LC624_08930 [Halobacteriales archaeon]|nr:hypothetical protein [Halobacteriales archaeon]
MRLLGALAVIALLALPGQALPPDAGAWAGDGSLSWVEGTTEPYCAAAAPVHVHVALAMAHVATLWFLALDFASPLPTCVSNAYACSTPDDPFAGWAFVVCQGLPTLGFVHLERGPGTMQVTWVFGYGAQQLDATLTGAP